MKDKKVFAVKTKFIFSGKFFITCENKKQAKEIVNEHCGMTTISGIHTTLPKEIVDWEFPCHPDKIID
jgi:hypothetical protein